MTTPAASPILFPPAFLAERRPVGDTLFQIDRLLTDLEKGRPADPSFLRDLSMRMAGEVEQEGDLPVHWQRWLVRFVHGRFRVAGLEPRRLEWLARLLQRLIMVVEVGTLMKLGPIRIQEMSLAAVLHDCGSAHLLGQGHLDRKQVQTAIQQGWEENLAPFRGEPWMEIVWTTKEQVDGSGYPTGLKGDAIPVEARIINLIASFQAIVQPRDYRISLMPSQALEMLLRKDRHRYDTRVATFLLKAMTPFPAGCLVAVRDVGVGEVVRPHSNAPMRPEVAVVLDERMRPLPNPRRVDIRAMPVLNVHKAFCLGELEEDIWRLFDPPAPLSVRDVAPPAPVQEETSEPSVPVRPAGSLFNPPPAAPREAPPVSAPQPVPAAEPAPAPVIQPVAAQPWTAAPTVSAPAAPPAKRTLSFADQMAKHEAASAPVEPEAQEQQAPDPQYVVPPVSEIVQPPSLFATADEKGEAEAMELDDGLFASHGEAEPPSDPQRALDPADHPFFRLLPEEVLAEVPFDQLLLLEMKKGEILLHRGDMADSMLLILSGQVEMTAPDGHNQPAVVGHRSGGEVVGELGLLDGIRLVDAKATRDGWYVPLAAPLVHRLMEEAPQVGSTLRALHRLHGSV